MKDQEVVPGTIPVVAILAGRECLPVGAKQEALMKIVLRFAHAIQNIPINMLGHDEINLLKEAGVISQ